MTTTKSLEVCANCDGEGWVCEDHPEVPWNGGDGCCGGAGMPCKCNAIQRKQDSEHASLAQAPKVSEGKKWPSREEFVAWMMSMNVPPDTLQELWECQYDYLTAHAMPEMCVDGMPSEEEIEKEIERSSPHWQCGFRHCLKFLRSRLKLRSVSEVREEYESNIIKEMNEVHAEHVARSEKLAQSLKDVRDAIVQNSMDTLWMPSCYSPSCTAVDWIDLDLAAYEAGRDTP
jgi:hypothetical protein